MRYRRLYLSCLVVGVAVVATACSGVRSFGISLDQSSGGLEVMGTCTDRGLRKVEVREAQESTVRPLIVGLEYVGGHEDMPRQVVLTDDVVGYRVEGEPGDALTTAARIYVYADYDDPTLIAADVVVDVADLDSEQVIVGDTGSGDPEAWTAISRAEFQDKQGSCGPQWGRIIAFVVAVSVASVALLWLVVRFVRGRRPHRTTSSLPPPPAPPPPAAAS